MEDEYTLMPTRLPDSCLEQATYELNKTYLIMDYLRRGDIIHWPNFTNCLPECGICSPSIPDHTYIVYNLLVIGFLLPIIGLFGLCGNCLSAFVYSRSCMRSTTNVYLCMLGCSDIAVICTALVVFFFDSIRRYSLQISVIYGVFAAAAYPAGLIAQTCSVYFTLAAAIDCFVQVCLPERFQRFFNRIGCSLVIGGCVVVFSIIYNIPRFYESVAFECWHSKFGSSSFEVCPTPFRYDEKYMYWYYYILYTVFLAVGPLVVLVILNSCIIVASVILKKGNSDDNVSLILIVLLFISCNTIALLLNIFEESLQETLEWRFNYLVDVSNLLVVFNSSFNFVIYYIFSQSFRRTFLHYFNPAKQHKHATTSTKAFLVKRGDHNDFTTNGTVLLKTTKFNGTDPPITTVGYACYECPLDEVEQSDPCNNSVNDGLSLSTQESAHNSVTRLFGVSRTEVLI